MDIIACEGSIKKAINSTMVSNFEKLVSVENRVAGCLVMQRGRLRHVSHALAEFLGYSSAQQVIDKSLWELIHPEDRKQVRIGGRKSAIHSKRDYFRVLRKDGSASWVVIQGEVLSLDGRPAFVGCMIGCGVIERQERGHRKNELAEQKAHLAAILQGIQDAIITVSPEMLVVDANSPVETLCGIDAKKMVGIKISQCLRSCNAACLGVLYQALAQKQPVRGHVLTCSAPSCHSRVVRANGVPLIDDLGNFLGAMLVIQDITPQRNPERGLCQHYEYKGIVGKSKAMQDVYRLVADLANLENAVLITGESGTGKKLIAKALHISGHRALEPFAVVNFSISDDRQGQFEYDDSGTLLLDEIGEASPLIQSKLLKVLQAKEFKGTGDNLPQRVNVRILASTKKDLKKKIKEGEFRQQLYDQLRFAVITLPALRERTEDIPLLVEHFRKMFNHKFNKKFLGIASEALSLLMDYPWPGNVRELEQVIEHAFELFDERLVYVHHLPVRFQRHRIAKPQKAHRVNEDLNEILKALSKTLWNKRKAAEVLGMSRQTLYRKLHAYGLL